MVSNYEDNRFYCTKTLLGCSEGFDSNTRTIHDSESGHHALLKMNLDGYWNSEKQEILDKIMEMLNEV